MNRVRRQFDTNSRVCQYLAGILLFGLSASGLASEAAVDPTDNGVDVIEDSTFDLDSRSSETSVAAEELIDPEPARGRCHRC